MLCATLVAMGSDVCGEPVGFKKVYVYNMKKNLSHIELCVCVLCLHVSVFSVYVIGPTQGCTLVCVVHRCGLLSDISPFPTDIEDLLSSPKRALVHGWWVS